MTVRTRGGGGGGLATTTHAPLPLVDPYSNQSLQPLRHSHLSTKNFGYGPKLNDKGWRFMTSLKFVYNTKIRAHKNLDASQFKVPGEQSRNSEKSRVNEVSGQIFSDQFRFLGNCPPTPPLSQH